MFNSAKIKLTVWYLVVIMTITLSFSALVYANVVNSSKNALETQRKRIEKQFEEYNRKSNSTKIIPIFDELPLLEIKQKTLVILAIINWIILVFSALSGYFLAGKTLKPIEIMVNKQKRFISDAAHEIKTPLTAMKTNLEVTLRDKDLNLVQAKEVLKSTINDVDSLSKFTNRLLSKSKYQSDSKKNFEKIELKELLENVTNNLKPLLYNRKFNLDLNQVEIMGDRDSLKELFTNLIENAIKYSQKDIDISLSSDKRNAQIRIKDYGIGLTKEVIPFIFDPFYRVDTARSNSTQEGYGLGLTIAKEIAEKHHGKIQVESILNKETVFTITLPLYIK